MRYSALPSSSCGEDVSDSEGPAAEVAAMVKRRVFRLLQTVLNIETWSANEGRRESFIVQRSQYIWRKVLPVAMQRRIIR